jgi:hypothetical protein
VFDATRNRRIDLAEGRSSPGERERIASLMAMVPSGLATAIDIGARDGFLSVALTEKVASVVALDLVAPEIQHPRVTVLTGDARRLAFSDETFDLVLCTEVLEHIASPELEIVCRELARVTRRYLLIGVPFRQDTRVGRLTCQACGRHNPPWGHVSVFDEARLHELFPGASPVRVSFAGSNRTRTNFVSAALNDWAGNPWGPYSQIEACIHCGARFVAPTRRSIGNRVASRTAHLIDKIQLVGVRAQPTWIHVLFEME